MRISKRVAFGVGTAIVAASLPLLAAPAHAVTNPPWEPDGSALGTITFYNAAGTVVTGGSNLNHLFDYAEASTTDALAGTKATLIFANPTPPASTPTGTFPTGIGSVPTAFPNAGAPSPLNTDAKPVVSLGAADGNLTDFIAAQTVNTAAGYAHVYQIRLTTSAPGGGGTTPVSKYWDADVLVNPTAHTWVETYPTAGAASTPTTTSLAVDPANSASQGASVTLTATVAAGATHPAGSVEFLQDGTSLGTATVNTSTGVATKTTTDLLASAPSGTTLTAMFTPTDTSTYSPSTSEDTPYTVNPTATKPKISGSGKVGATEKCTEPNLNFGVKATYEWQVAGKKAATGSKFKVPASAYNKDLTCSATVKDGAGPSDSATSKSVKVGLGAALKATKAPKLSGAGKAGKTEKVSKGTWSPKAKSYSYQWFDGKKAIKGATKSKLKLPSSAKGDKVTCEVTASAKGYADGTETTKAITVG